MTRTRTAASKAAYTEFLRSVQPTCPTCRDLGYVIVELYDPATGKTVGVSSIDCFKCKKGKE